ncbi:hypothetical protein VTL71DRAFT_14965 [Oculimacula yallundae]|uniref:Methyltransferase type 11 domain-containing protein n=1 Tax=Oculimacula yallundae TaxID=86028 RepID=A0ABR4CF96_9HELO
MANPTASDLPTGPASNLPAHFNNLSKIYPLQTGNSTLNLFASICSHVAPITSSSIIHDNACGPGSATSVILANLEPEEEFPTIIGTDMVPGMIDAFNSSITTPKSSSANKISALVMRSEELSFPDSHFTHSITNFSIFNFASPVVCVKEIYRTLKPSGQAFITTWKDFAIGNVIHETQRRIRPDLPVMPFSGAEYHDVDAVKDVMVEAGFEREGLEVLSPEVVVKGEDLEGLIGFACGPFTEKAREGWTSEEKGRWREVVLEILEERKKESGGLRFEGWAILGRK